MSKPFTSCLIVDSDIPFASEQVIKPSIVDFNISRMSAKFSRLMAILSDPSSADLPTNCFDPAWVCLVPSDGVSCSGLAVCLLLVDPGVLDCRPGPLVEGSTCVSFGLCFFKYSFDLFITHYTSQSRVLVRFQFLRHPLLLFEEIVSGSKIWVDTSQQFTVNPLYTFTTHVVCRDICANRTRKYLCVSEKISRNKRCVSLLIVSFSMLRFTIFRLETNFTRTLYLYLFHNWTRPFSNQITVIPYGFNTFSTVAVEMATNEIISKNFWWYSLSKSIDCCFSAFRIIFIIEKRSTVLHENHILELNMYE